MAPTDLSVQEQRAPAHKQRVANDFSIQVATVNGSGSQTANLVLLRSILLMGVPVPIVIRMEGTNVDEGKRLLEESGMNFTTADSMDEAANQVVKLAG